MFAWFQCFVCFERPSCSEFAPRQKRMFWGHTPLEERGIVIFAWFQVLFISSAPHVLGVLVPVLALCSVCFIKSYVLESALVSVTIRPLLVCLS